jgi:hypothetical protein
MRIRVGLENGFEGKRSIAWALDFPGCVAYGSDSSEALLRFPQAVIRFCAWADHHAGAPWAELGDMDIRLVETWEVYTIQRAFNPANDLIEINAWFRDDWRPLQAEEIASVIQVLQWQRADLLQIVTGLDDARLNRPNEGEKWTIRGVLAHVATAEWWYLERFDLFGPRSRLPRDPFERIALVRQSLLDALPALAGKDWVFGKDGEFWSPRKLLRRAVWHERDHIEHIMKLL